MNIKTKIVASFIVVALVPCVLFLTLGFMRKQVDLVLVLASIVSILVALAMAWLLVKSFSLSLRNLTLYFRELMAGKLDTSLSENTYQISKEYADFASLLSMTLNAKNKEYVENEQRLHKYEQELKEKTQVLTKTKEDIEHLNKVTIDRELKMIEVKAALRDALKKLGESTHVPALDTEVAQDYDDSEQGRAAMLNILEDLQTEKRLLATEKAKDDAILRSIGEGIIVANEQGVITFLNKNAQVLLNLSELKIGTDTWEMLPPLAEPKTGKQITIEELPLYKAVHGEAVVKQSLLLQDEKNPQLRCWIEMTAMPIVVAGLTLGGVVTFRDVTKEQEVDRAKTEFVSLASHQLRTPLSSINWYAEMLLAGDAGELNDEQRSYLDEVYQGNQRMVDLINSLLNVSRLELGTLSVDPEDTDVIAIAQSVMNELAPQIKEREINLTTKFNEETPTLYADPKLLRMVIQNLTSNAVKYTPIGGSVSVYIAPKDDSIAITVADNGLGIPKADQSMIFTKLFRATNARESNTDGTGLGLYIIKSIVEHTGGTIRFTSDEGKGTIFYVELPKSGMQKKEGKKSLS